MAVILKEISKNYNYYIYTYSDQRTINWPLMGSPIPVLIITGVYLWFVLKAGPAFMRNRQPFHLDKLIQIYNVIQILVNAHLVWEGITKVYGPWGKYSFICEPIDLTVTDFNLHVLQKFYIYFILKIVDLLDTIFFVLRKKQAQTTFLHVYHHALMVLTIWIAMRFLPGGHAVYVGVINSFVHTIMYFYYFLTNYDKEYRKNVWWKKYLTILQMLQFGSILLHFLILLAQPNCNYPKLIILLMLPQNLFMFLMFADFYRKTYLTPTTASNKNE